MTDAQEHNTETAPNANGARRSSHGEGVDRKIEKKTFTPKRIAILLASFLVLGALGYGVWEAATGGEKLNVEREKIQVSTARKGPFQEYIPVTGTVLPGKTVYLEAAQGGRVEEVYAQSGAQVAAGQPLLRLSNPDLRARLLSNETQLSEQESRLEEMRFRMQQNRLDLRQQLALMDFQIQKLQRRFERERQLYEKGLIAEETFQNTRSELQYQRRRRELTREAFRQDSLLQATQLRQRQASLERMRQRFSALQEGLGNLTVRAPITGQLSALDAQVGQIRPAGTRFGQIDVLDSLKLSAAIDEFYIERVRPGQAATTEPLDGERRQVTVTRVYPEVQNGQFKVDLEFAGAAPEGLRRGQSVRLRLKLSAPEEALLLARGGFYQSTGGSWAYVLGEEGEVATRQPIRLGRQNPEHFEVLSGLEPGDKVVTSSYETFGEADRLVLE